jgi:hypothetical protein
MTTLLVRTRHDGPSETAPPVAELGVHTALAPSRELPEGPAVPSQTRTNLPEHTVAELLAFYVAEVLPSCAPTTQYQRTRFLAMVEGTTASSPSRRSPPPGCGAGAINSAGV